MAIPIAFRRRAPAKADDASPMNEAELYSVAEDMADASRPIRWGIWLLALGFGGFFIWALVAPLDEGVPASGTVVVDTKRQTVQHLTGGIVRQIYVREAQKVKAGDVIMRLDDTVAQANYQSARQQYFALLAQQSRLEAEQKGAKQIQFAGDLLANRDDRLASDFINVQRQIFQSRRIAVEGQQAILTQTFAATQDLLAGYQSQLEGKQTQLKLMREQLEGTRELARQGYMTRNRWFDEERLAADLAGSVGELTANIARTRNSLAELQLRIIQVQREFLRDVEGQLAETTRDAQVAGERFRTTREELARTGIRSPADGYVVGLTAHTVGGVIGPGARIMDVVPEGAELTLEARVEPHLIDRIHAGLTADIRSNAFIDNPNLVIDGRVLSVSADLIAPEQPNQLPYYLARIAVTPEGMKKLDGRQLQPGMPAEVVIKTGERTLMQYLMKPVIRRLSTSLREH